MSSAGVRRIKTNGEKDRGTDGEFSDRLVLKVHFPGDSPTTYRTVQFDRNQTVADAVALVARVRD